MSNMAQTAGASSAPLITELYANGNTQPTIAFTNIKKEQFHPTRGYKLLTRKLKQFANVELYKEEFSAERFAQYDIVVIAAPNEEITAQEFAEIKAYVDRGGSVMLLLSEGHGGKYHYLNALLAPLGIALNEDCVVRTVLHTYLHPKEVCVTNGVTNREINRAAGKIIVGGGSSNAPSGGSFGAANNNGANATNSFGSSTLNGTNRGASFAAAAAAAAAKGSPSAAEAAAAAAPSSLVFVYPHGLTMSVQRPGIPILSSGFMAYPLNRPIACFYESAQLIHPAQIILQQQQQQAAATAAAGLVAGAIPSVTPQYTAAQLQGLPPHRGKFLILGSALMFEDAWLPKEENDKLAAVLFDLLLHKIKLNAIDADNPDITDYHYLPDTASLADRLRVAVEEPEELPRDVMGLFETTPFRFDTDMIPEVVQLYEQLHIKHEALTLIHPEFQAPLPPCLPATFDPIHRELPPPALDLFDLDEQFSNERIRLSQLTNKCIADEDIEYFIMEGAEIMGISKKLRSPRNKDPRALLDFVFRQLLQYKKNNPDVPLEQSGGGGGGAGGVGALGSSGLGGRPGNSGGGGTGNNASSRVGGGQQPQQSGSAVVGGQQPQQGGNMTRVLRITGRPDGTVDLTPFERNAPWQLTLHVDFGRNAIMGQLILQRSDPNFVAQEAVVQGGVVPLFNPATGGDASAAASGGNASTRQLEWVATVVNVVGEHVRFVYRATLAPAGPMGSQMQLNGVVEFAGSSMNFMYVTDELS